jgi:GTP-binding protein LepA
MDNIRNFVIISHIDHGKSTLADRFLELTQTVEKRKMREQYLDQMELEREKGITIKLQPVRMEYEIRHPELVSGSHEMPKQVRHDSMTKYILNLIDTPGHVDFTYEVSRSLQAVEGAILLVDATKGIQAQTLANLHLALEQNLVIIPAINKIDLENARVEEVEKEIEELFGGIFSSRYPERSEGSKAQEMPKQVWPDIRNHLNKISAKTGEGVKELLEALIEKVPPPAGERDKPLRALVFDSVYDSYRGVLAYVRIMDGEIKQGEPILLMASGAKSEAIEVGVFKPNLVPVEKLSAGEIGYIATGFKDVSRCRVGDTITNANLRGRNADGRGQVSPLPGYREPKPMIFASFYPANDKDFDFLRDALGKLKLQDAALVFEPEASALGRGFKCGFLGMLHLEIISERLRREFGLNLVITTPSLTYKLTDKRGQETTIYSAHQMPDPHLIESMKELWVKLEVVSPAQYLGKVMQLFEALEGNYKETKYLTAERLVVEYEVPLREIIVDFYDKLKSATSGYASMSYEILGWRSAELARLDVLIAGEKEEAFSKIVSRKKVQQEGRLLVERLKEVIPPQLFVVSIQAAVGGKIIARENIRAMRKDVTGYLYGGDYTRKRKLLEKQKRGKKKMKTIGKVNIPQEAFLAVLKK